MVFLSVKRDMPNKRILEKAGMQDCKPLSSPMVSKDYHQQSSPAFTDASFYKSIVGSLQYLCFTRPDLSYAVNSI